MTKKKAPAIFQGCIQSKSHGVLINQVWQVWLQLIRIPEGYNVLKIAAIRIIAELNVEAAEVVEQKNVFPFVAIRQNITREVKRV